MSTQAADTPPGADVVVPGVAALRTEEWFRNLWATQMRAVLGYALRRVTYRADAADVVADTFLVAWRRRGAVPADDDEARAWLYGTARRVLANHRRGEERRDRLADRLREHLRDEPVAAETPDLTAVRAALDSLSPEDRELLTLTMWEELTPSQLGVAMGLPAGTVRTRLHRARRRVAKRLAEIDMQRAGGAGHYPDETATTGRKE